MTTDATPRTGTILDYLEFGGAAGHPPQQGRPADHEHGVLYQAPYERYADGFAEHARRCALALHTAGCPVHLRSLSPTIHVGTEEDVAVQRMCAAILHTSIKHYSLQVHQVVPTAGLLERLTTPSPSQARFMDGAQLAAMNYFRVLSTVWERSPIPENDVAAMNRVGQVWVACQANVDALRASGVTTDVRVVPVPYFDDDPHLAAADRPRRPGPVRFYHVGKWEPRKNQHAILGGFLQAFKVGEAEFYLKTSQFGPNIEGYPDGPLSSLKAWMTTSDTVRDNGWVWKDIRPGDDLAKYLGGLGMKIYQAIISAPQLVALHRHGDVYVTCSRGEGFDMPAFDSKLSGNLMVYGPSGGPQDFAGEHDQRVEPRGEIFCHPFYRWNEGARYLDYDVLDILQAMRLAAASIRAGKRARGRDLGDFSAARVGGRMLRNLRDLVEPHGGKVF